MGEPKYEIWTYFPEDIRRKVCERKYSMFQIESPVTTIPKYKHEVLRTVMLLENGEPVPCCPLGVALFELGIRIRFLAIPVGLSFSIDDTYLLLAEKVPSIVEMHRSRLRQEIDRFVEDYDSFSITNLCLALGIEEENGG